MADNIRYNRPGVNNQHIPAFTHTFMGVITAYIQRNLAGIIGRLFVNSANLLFCDYFQAKKIDIIN